MLTTIFEINPIVGQPATCEVAIDDEFYFVNINGKSIGTMIEDDQAEFGFRTEDEELKPLLGDIANGLHEQSGRYSFAEDLKNAHEEILKTEFIGDETLVVEVSEETDLKMFGIELQKGILDFVSFETHIEVVVTKEGSEEVFEIGVN